MKCDGQTSLKIIFQLFSQIAGRPNLNVDLRLRRMLWRPRSLSSEAGRSLRYCPQSANDEQVHADLADDGRGDVRSGRHDRI